MYSLPHPPPVHHPKLRLCPHQTKLALGPPPLSPWHPAFFFLSLCIWLFSIPCVSGLTQYVSFCNWLISLGVTSSRFIHVVASVRPSLPFFKNCFVFIISLCNSRFKGHQSAYKWSLILWVPSSTLWKQPAPPTCTDVLCVYKQWSMWIVLLLFSVFYSVLPCFWFLFACLFFPFVACLRDHFMISSEKLSLLIFQLHSTLLHESPWWLLQNLCL